MFRLWTILRRLLAVAGSLLLLAGIILALVHTRAVRRFVLAQAQVRLSRSSGLAIDVRELDYNLLSSRFELHDLSLQHARVADLPPLLTAHRLVAVVPLWRLLRGSFDTARIRVDGLSIRLVTRPDGKNNVPPLPLPAAGRAFDGPAVLVTGGTIDVRDERRGFFLHLPLARLSAEWNAAARRYVVAAESSGGQLHWKDRTISVDRFALSSAVTSAGFEIESLRIESGLSRAAVRGSVSGAPYRIVASADLDLDLRDLCGAGSASGNLEAHISAAGPVQALRLDAVLKSRRVAAAGVVVRNISADLAANFGEVYLRGLSAAVLGGRLTLRGALRPAGASELRATLTGFEPAQLPVAIPLSFGRSTATAAASWPGLAWRLAKARVSLESAWPEGAPLHADLTIGLPGRTLSGTASGEIESPAQLGLRTDAVRGAARWSASVGGTLARPTASLRVSANDLSIAGRPGGHLQIEADYADHEIAIGRVRLAWAGQQVELHGNIAGTSMDAPLRIEGTIEGNTAAIAPVGGAVSGVLELSGTIGHPIAAATIRATDLLLHKQPLTHASMEAGGRLDLRSRQYVAQASARGLLPNTLPVTGLLQFDAHGEGSLDNPAFTIRLDGADVRAGEVVLGGVHAEADGADGYASVSLAAPALNSRLTSTVAMHGSWPFQLVLDARATRLPAGPAASFDACVRARGTLLPPRLERAAGVIDSLRLEGGPRPILADGAVELSYASGRFHVGRLQLQSGASSLRLSGDLPWRDDIPPGAVTLGATVDLASLPHSGLSRLEGTATIQGAITGSVRHWRPSGTVVIRGGSVQSRSVPFAVEAVEGILDLQDGVIRTGHLAGTAGGGTFTLAGSLPLHLLVPGVPVPARGPAPLARLTALVDNLSLSRGTADQAITTTLGGRIEAEARALSLAALVGTVELTQLQITTPRTSLQQAGPTRIDISDSVAALRHLEIAGGLGNSLRASGTVQLTGSFPLSLEAAGTTDLALLSAVAPPLDAAGPAKVDLRVGGTLASPEITGFLEVNRGAVRLPEPKLQAAGIRLRADLAGGLITVKELTGTLNGGAFTGGGEVRLDRTGLRDISLFLKGKDAFVEHPAGVKTTSAIDVKLTSQQDRLLLSGRVDVQEGYYESAIDLFSRPDTGLPSPASAPGQPVRPVALAVDIVTRRPVEMDNNLGRLSATAKLRLTGTVAKPGVLGTLDLEQDGRLYFGDRTYYIERGTVRFADESKVAPELDIQAYTRTGDYTIRLGLTGNPSELTTTFTSDPPLSRDDVIAVLLTGKTVAENRGVDLRALEATSLATGAMNASLSSQVRRTIGISRVSIQPGAVAAESNPGARITVTQDFTSSLRLLYSMNLSDSNDQIWVGEYDISRRFTTRAVKQSDNTYRGEFRHDVRFGGSSPAPQGASASSRKRKISQVRFAGGDPFTPDQLALVFKVKSGRTYKPIDVRKKTERLTRFLMKNGFLESRVRLDREDDGASIALTVRIDLGPPVDFAFRGANMPRKQKSRLRQVWHAGLSDEQRRQAAADALLGYLAQKGYPRARADVQTSAAGDRKSVQFDIQPGARYHGIKVAPEGAAPRHAHEIQALLRERRLRLALYRDPRRAADAVTRYYQQRGYLAAKIDSPRLELDERRRTGRIVIPTAEGPLFRVGALEFSGNRALTHADLCKGIPLEPGAVFEPARLDPAVAAIKQKYGDAGYRQADVDPAVERHDDRAVVDIRFTVVENRQTSVGAIAVQGTRHTSAAFVKSRLRIGEGQVASSGLIRDSVRNLSQTGAYASTDVQVKPPVLVETGGKPVQVADLLVAVAEPKPFRLLYGGLYDSGNGPGFIADFQNHNFLGAGRIFGLRLREDAEISEARLYVTRPFWRTHRLSTTLAAYFKRQTEYLQTVPTETLGFSVQQDLQLRSRWLLSYGYRYERQRGFVPDPAAPEIPATVVWVAPVTLTMSRDARDAVLDATRGSFISHSFELAPRFLGSDYPYTRYYVQYFKYFPLTAPHPVPYGEKPQRSRLVFASGSRLGLQKGFNAEGAVLTDRFYAGGGTTVRGFRQDELGPRLANGQPAGGNAVFVLNEELRYPLGWIFDAVTFVDIGNVFPRVSDFRLSELRSAGGFGLRIRNPFVVLRFDYGFKFGRRPGETLGAFFFSIGQAF